MTRVHRALSARWAPLFLVPACLLAVQAPETVDDMYARARHLASEGQRKAAREVCREALRRSPDYHDIRILLGRLYTWDDHYDEGRAAFQYVLQRKPGYLDAREALIDLETWSDHPQEALRVCNEGLALAPQSSPLLYRKARLLKASGDLPGALSAARQAVAADPGNAKARTLLGDLVELTQRDKLSVSYTYDHFDQTFDPWRTVSLAVTHRFNAGSVIARLNHATRFGESGNQVEMDAYPHLADGTYAYLNAGYSGASIFPRTRYGAELYHNFPMGIEASLGLRHLQFPGSGVTIYTGSFGKYWGNYLFTLRGNTTPSSAGSSKSGSLAVRRYFSDAEDYLTVTAGTGVSPDQSNASLEILNLRSRSLGLSGQGRLGRAWVLLGSLAWERQDVSATTTRTQTTASLGLEWTF
jgi:YaiO family outer membrane protein